MRSVSKRVLNVTRRCASGEIESLPFDDALAIAREYKILEGLGEELGMTEDFYQQVRHAVIHTVETGVLGEYTVLAELMSRVSTKLGLAPSTDQLLIYIHIGKALAVYMSKIGFSIDVLNDKELCAMLRISTAYYNELIKEAKSHGTKFV